MQEVDDAKVVVEVCLIVGVTRLDGEEGGQLVARGCSRRRPDVRLRQDHVEAERREDKVAGLDRSQRLEHLVVERVDRVPE